MLLVKSKNKYNLEDSKSGSWTFKIIRGIEYLNNDIINALKNFDKDIYYNDITGKHWFFDFKVNNNILGNVWIEGINIDCNNMIIEIGLYK